MLTGWVGLHLFLLAVLKSGGRIEGWHAVVWILATFLGMWIGLSGRREVEKEQGRKEGGRRTENGGWWAAGGRRWVAAGVLTGIGLALPIFFSWVMGHFTDFSWDGMTSRGITVRNLMIGHPGMNELALGHVTAGFLAKLTGNWQGGKAINLTLTFVSFCYAMGCLQALGFQGWRQLCLALLTALNPVAVYQISCFQIDGHVASLFTCLAFAAVGIWGRPASDPRGWMGFLTAFLSLSCAKNSGIFYAITILILLMAFLLCFRELQPRPKTIICFSLLALLVTGLATHQFAGFGQLNSERLKLVSDIRSAGFGVGGGAAKVHGFLDLPRPAIFVASVFSMTEVLPEEIRLKPPFAMTRRELRVFEELTPDPRAGGFGPQFSGAMLLAGIGCTALLLLCQPIYGPGLFLALTAILSSYFSQLWWARWTPQNWLILIGMLMTLVHAGWDREAMRRGEGAHVLRATAFTRWIQAVAVLALAATSFNVALVFIYYGVGMVRQENVLKRQIEFAKSLGQPISIHLKPNHDGSYFLASELWFADKGYRVTRLEDLPPKPRIKLNMTETFFALPANWRSHLQDPGDEALFRKRRLIED
jgi:hypothetical protein